MKKLFSQNVFKLPERLKWILCTVSEKENVYSDYFLVFNQNIEINRKLLKKVTFSVKSYFFRKRDGFPLKVVNFRKTLKKGSFMWF